ncbi:MAG: 23S rRNA (guanine1835-N2)-methyltransferase [Flavobacteriales bacterium]|jgi:23S rRNA (guanine1835-N2)-methyltransferase
MLNSNELCVFGQSFKLERYPIFEKDGLKAWDSADCYLLESIKSLIGASKKICVLNDNFGALSAPLNDYEPYSYSDSWMAMEAIRLNSKASGNVEKVQFHSTLSTLLDQPIPPDLIVGRVPKCKSQLIYLLDSLRNWVAPDCQLFLAGMDKHLSRGQFDLVSQYFGPAEFYPGYKKARIWRSVVDKSLAPTTPSIANVSLDEFDLELKSHANVFSREKLDIGSRFLLENISLIPTKRNVADLACGNGVLGLAYLKFHEKSHLTSHPTSSISFFDESFQAIQSVEENIEFNMSNSDVNTKTYVNDGLLGVSEDEFDLILCNPPFHQLNTVSTAVARRLFEQAHKSLADGGEFWVIANRHLGYHHVIKKIFSNCSQIKANSKFTILSAVKGNSKTQ